MKISELIESMSAAGAPMEAILIAIRAIEEGQDAIAARRATERDRKRRQRAKVDEQDGTVTGQSRDSHKDTPLSLPPNEKISNPPTHTPENITTREGRQNRTPAKPDDVAEQTWRDFVRHRNAKKAPVTETALAGIRREAGKAGWTMDAALAETVTRGWQSFKADWAMPPPQAASAAPGSFLAHLAGQSP